MQDAAGPATGHIPAWRAELATDPRRVVVIDDDPTGTQSVSGVDVMLDSSPAAFERFLDGDARGVYALSNSRAWPEDAAVARVRAIAADAEGAARLRGEQVAFLLRGDSTLRGHVFAEADGLAPGRPVLFVPAFVDGGRITRDGVHYLRTVDGLVNVADTEFAADPAFGYRSRDLPGWVREVSGGRRRGVAVSLRELRRDGPDAVARALLDAEPKDVVLPDVETEADVLAVAVGLVRAETAGARPVVRCAASLAAARIGSTTRRIERIELPQDARTLVVCGSFTRLATRQVEALGELWRTHVEVRVDDVRRRPAGTLARELGEACVQRLAERDSVLLATERTPVHEPDGELATALMDVLVGAAQCAAGHVDAALAKGGITAARVAIEAFGAGWATVAGQPAPGVPLWHLDRDGCTLPYVVVPGNIGDDRTVVDLHRMLTAGSRDVDR